MKPRYIILLFTTSLVMVTGCSKKDFIVENTTITPDLSNPIIQRISNQTWYKNPSLSSGETHFIWESKEHIPNPSEALASLLYQAAFQNITLNRDGTSNMVFIPPFFPNVYIHNKGNWQVAKTEENAIILNTETPVSNATAKVKVLNLETQEQVASLNLSMDFGNRLMEFKFINNPYISDPVKLEAADFHWLERQVVATAPLNAKDFVGAWASASDETTLANREFKEEEIIRIVKIEDLLLSTPTFIAGQVFDLRADGTASIGYKLFETLLAGAEDKIQGSKTVVSNATWEVKGNKIFVHTDEALFYSLGELLYHLPVYGEYLTEIGEFAEIPMRIQKYRYYAIEIIEKREDGFWSRITTNDAIFYAFMFKSQFDLNNTINVKNAF
ncbi:MAG: hypothetical protein ACTHZ7_06130 [Sphingobacterium sp.]